MTRPMHYTTLQPVKPNTIYKRQLRAEQAAGTWRGGRVNAAAARARLHDLQAMLSMEAISDLSGLRTEVIWGILREEPNRREKILRTTEAAVLAVQTNPIDLRSIQPHRIISATGTRRRLQALARMGWPAEILGAELGMSRRPIQHFRTRPTITAQNAADVADLCRRLSRPGMVGPSRITRQRALAAGWVDLAAWECIDDPRCVSDPGESHQTRLEAFLEDLTYLATVGLSLEGACARIGRTPHNLERTLQRYGRHDLYARLMDNGSRRGAA